MIDFLIVDDDEAFVELVRIFLEEKGYSVASAIDGNYGYREILNKKPIITLCDILMPNKDGFELCSDVKNSNIKTKFIIMTNYSNKSTKLFKNWVDADGYIEKTLNVEDMIPQLESEIKKLKE